ncbi:hypothetical protein ACJMK2_005561 [Sinanodonta woodiana]|uniref:Uncharacterized protein n=1 Tax=Sinanodonta woodiana TaxID=1069815 RepID=A0ABD3VTG9_SINWO
MEAEDLLPTTTPVRKVYSTKSIFNTTTTPVYTKTVKQQVKYVTSSPARNSEDGIYSQSYIVPEIKVLSAEKKRNVPLPQLKNSKINSTKVAVGVNKILKAIGHEKQDNVNSTKIQLQKIGDTIVIKVTPVEKVNSSAVLDNVSILSPKINNGDHSQQKTSLDSTQGTISRPSTPFKIFKEMQIKKTNRPPSTPSTFMRSSETKPDVPQLLQLEIVETSDDNKENTRPHQTTAHGHNGTNKHNERQIRMNNAIVVDGSHHNRQIQTTNGIRNQNPGQDKGILQHKNKLRPKPLPVPQTQLKRFTNSSRPSQPNQALAEPLKVKVNVSTIANNNNYSNDIKTNETNLRSYYNHKVSETSIDSRPNLHEKHREVQNIPFSVIKRNETKPGSEMKLKSNLQTTLLQNAGQKKENLDKKIKNDGTVSHQSSIYVGGNNVQAKSVMNKANKLTKSVSHKRFSTLEFQSVKLVTPQTFVSSSSALTKLTPVSITISSNDNNVSQTLRSEIANQPPSQQTQRKGLGIPFQNNAKGGKLEPHDVRENSKKAHIYSKDSGNNNWVKEGTRQISSEQGPSVRRLDPLQGNLSHPNRQRPLPRGVNASTNGSKLKPESNDSIRHHRTTTNNNLMPLVLSSPLRKLEDIRLKQVQGNIRTGKKNLLFQEHTKEMTTSLLLNVIPVSATEHPIKTGEEGITVNLDNYEMTTIHEVINDNLLITSEYDITTSASKMIMFANRLSGEARDSFYPSQSVSADRRRLDNTVQNSKPVHYMNNIVDTQKRFRQEVTSVRPIRQGRQMGPRRPRGPLVPYERGNGAINRESFTGTSLRDAFSNRNNQNEFRPPGFARNNRHNNMLPRMNMLREKPKLPTQPNVSAEEGGEEGEGGGGEGEGVSKTSTTTIDTFRYRNVGTSLSVPYWSSSRSQSVYPNYRNENYDQQSSRRQNNQQNWIQHRQPQRTSAWNKGQIYDSPTGNEYVERSRQDRRPLHSEISGYDKPAQYDRTSNFHKKATEQYHYNPHQRGGTNEYQGGDRRYSSRGMETSTLWNEYPHDRTEPTTHSWLADDRIYTNNNAYNGNNAEHQSSSASNFDRNNNLNNGHLQDRRLQTTLPLRWHDTTTRVYRNGNGWKQRNQNEFRPTTTPSANNAW